MDPATPDHQQLPEDLERPNVAGLPLADQQLVCGDIGHGVSALYLFTHGLCLRPARVPGPQCDLFPAADEPDGAGSGYVHPELPTDAQPALARHLQWPDLAAWCQRLRRLPPAAAFHE